MSHQRGCSVDITGYCDCADGRSKTPERRPADAFHDHLDGCQQCREMPWSLCPTGAEILRKSV